MAINPKIMPTKSALLKGAYAQQIIGYYRVFYS